MKIKNAFILRNVAGLNVVTVIDSSCDFDGMISLNETAAFMWNILTNGASRDDLINALTSEYDVDNQTASADVDGFLSTLRENGILDESST